MTIEQELVGVVDSIPPPPPIPVIGGGIAGRQPSAIAKPTVVC